MGKRGTPRTMVAVRLSPAGLQQIDQLAQQAGATRSDTIRRLLAAAIADPRTRAQVIRGGG